MDNTHETLFCTLDVYIKEKPVGLSVAEYSSLLPADCIRFFKDKITISKHVSTDKCKFYKCTENPKESYGGLFYDHSFCHLCPCTLLYYEMVHFKMVHYNDMYEAQVRSDWNTNRLIHKWFIWQHLVWWLTPLQTLMEKSTLKDMHIYIYWVNCWLTVC